MTRPSTVVATVATLAALVGAGCGGGSEALDDYRADANEICIEGHEAAASESTVAQNPRESPKRVAYGLEGALDIRSFVLDELEGLAPPDELADQHDDLVAAGRERQEVLKSLIREIERSDDDPAATLTERIPELNEQTEESDEIVDEIGGIELCEIGSL